VSAQVDCPLCGGASQLLFTVGDRNRRLSDERFPYMRCDVCRSIFNARPPTDLSRFYPGSYYVFPSAAELELGMPVEQAKLDLLSPFADGTGLVEIGSGPGGFAHAAKQAGFDVTALEMDARACRHLREAIGVEAIETDSPEHALAALPPPNAIVMWHVVEHLRRPWDTLAAIAQALAPGGVLALATPNPDALQFRVLGSRWAHIDAPRHLFLLPLSALEARARSLGLRLVTHTTSDPAGRHWNAFGWEYAVRREPASVSSTRASRALAAALAGALAPLERRGMSGAAYTAVFVKE
jgi:2-polyprenyl-3-methyl-5-hydroxy-6-metoxy-1,4-benzoquinol methylase